MSTTVNEPGNYTFSCQHPDGSDQPKYVLAFGQNLFWELLRSLAGTASSILGSLAVVVGCRHRRDGHHHRRRHQEAEWFMTNLRENLLIYLAALLTLSAMVLSAVLDVTELCALIHYLAPGLRHEWLMPWFFGRCSPCAGMDEHSLEKTICRPHTVVDQGSLHCRQASSVSGIHVPECDLHAHLAALADHPCGFCQR